MTEVMTATPYLCSDALTTGGSKRLRVDLQDVKMFDLELGNQLERSPAEYLPIVSLLQQHCLGVLGCGVDLVFWWSSGRECLEDGWRVAQQS